MFTVTRLPNGLNIATATMPGWLAAFVERNPVSHMATAMRGLFAGTAGPGEIALALALPVALTVLLAPVVLWLYRRR